MFLVTGGTGFIGQRLLSFFNKNSFSFRVLSRNPLSDNETILCDFSKDVIPARAFDGIDTVFHLAGIAHNLGDDAGMEGLYRSVNVDATVRLAELAVQNGVQRFVFVSSVKAGGSSIDRHCKTEDDQGEPDGIYGKTKREAELRLLEISEKSDLKVSIIRPTLVYGPKVKGNLRSMLSLLEKGRFPPLPEVGNRRSMIHVDDLVRAILFLGNDYENNGEIYIASDGMAYSSREIYKQLCHSLGRPVASWAVPKFLFDLVGLLNSRMKRKFNKLFGDAYSSSEKLQSTGFKPQRSLRDMNATAF